MKNLNKIIMVIMGTLIGAGFASGREIYLFFGKYGVKGIIGIILSSFLTSFIVYKVLIKIEDKPIYNYNELLDNKYNKIIRFIVNSFLLISFFIMVAAFSAFVNQNYSISVYFSSLIFVLICYIVFEKSLNGMMKINSFIVPILLLFIILIGLRNIQNLKYGVIIEEENLSNYELIISSILYTSYNSIILIPVLVSMKVYIINKKQIKLVSIIVGLLLIILSIIIFHLLVKDMHYIRNLEMPLIKIIDDFGKGYKYIYSFIIISSILTSAISAGYSFLRNISCNEKMYKINLIIMCVASVFISKVGFSNLVSTIYPLFGVLGILQILLIIRN